MKLLEAVARALLNILEALSQPLAGLGLLLAAMMTMVRARLARVRLASAPEKASSDHRCPRPPL